MKEFLDVTKIVSKDQSSKQEQELIDSMVTKIEGSESCDKNLATIGVENKVAGSQSKHYYKEVKIIEERLGLFFFSSLYRSFFFILKIAFKIFYS